MKNLAYEELSEIVDLIGEGLSVDGAHHKQWFLEQILIKILDPEELESMKEDWAWEEGIPS